MEESKDKNDIINALVRSLEPLNYVYALWEGGAAAFNRVDKWSDIDLLIVARDDYIEEVFHIAERALNSIGNIDLKYKVPLPTWHGHSQIFYRLDTISEFNIIDLVVMKHSNPNKFLEKEIHGDVIIYFDKIYVHPIRLNYKEFKDKLNKRVNEIGLRIDMFSCFVNKEIFRENYIEAIEYYNRFILDTLIEVLRINCYPFRYNFRARYIYYDLPQEITKKLEDFYFLNDINDLETKYNLALTWLKEEYKKINLDNLISK